MTCKYNSKVKIHENRLENKIKPTNLVYLKNNRNELKTWLKDLPLFFWYY